MLFGVLISTSGLILKNIVDVTIGRLSCWICVEWLWVDWWKVDTLKNMQWWKVDNTLLLLIWKVDNCEVDNTLLLLIWKVYNCEVDNTNIIAYINDCHGQIHPNIKCYALFSVCLFTTYSTIKINSSYEINFHYWRGVPPFSGIWSTYEMSNQSYFPLYEYIKSWALEIPSFSAQQQHQSNRIFWKSLHSYPLKDEFV